VIFGAHEFGDMTVEPGADGTASLMTITIRDVIMGGVPVSPYEILSRVDVERLRDRCEEALS
jgi:hypothetical protein